ncbi:MAG: putative alpha/beta-fold hydrolase, partial [Flavobacterium sp.]
GHVGFMTSFKPKENTWLEFRIERFIRENIQVDIL